MAKTVLTKDSQFIVGEDKVLDVIMTILFFGLFLYGLVDAILKHFAKLNYLNFLFLLALYPAILYFIKGRAKRIYIRINKSGIYQDEVLITNWGNFLKAYIHQKDIVFPVIKDSFTLVVEYMKDGQSQGFRRRIPLTNTQNKSEEEIMAAVKFFFKENERSY